MATTETILEATIKAGVEHFGGFPSGTMIAFAGKSVPDGWLLCNGALVSRTTYAKLFAAIGTAWGAGDGSTTFKLPDADGRVMQGVTDVRKVGQYRKAGVPNITGSVGRKSGTTPGGQSFSDCALENIQMVGALYATASGKQYDIGNNADAYESSSVVNIDASRVSSIYSNETSVQPPAFQTLIIIKC